MKRRVGCGEMKLCRSQEGRFPSNISLLEDYQEGAFCMSLEKQATNPVGPDSCQISSISACTAVLAKPRAFSG
jgi:hypothetical protein